MQALHAGVHLGEAGSQEATQLLLQLCNLTLKLPKVNSKLHLAVVQWIVWLFLEGTNEVVETCSKGFNPLNVGLLQHREMLHGVYKAPDLVQTPTEGHKLAKDIHLRDLKGAAAAMLLLSLMEAFLVALVELCACIQSVEECGRGYIPHTHMPFLCDVLLACRYHLIGYLKDKGDTSCMRLDMTHKTWPSVAHFDKERSHSLRSVVVAGDSIHHLYGGDEAGNGLQHAHRVTLIEWLAELLQGVQVLEVVFCLI